MYGFNTYNRLLGYGIENMIVVSDLMTIHKYIGRPKWMFFRWIPIRRIRYYYVSKYRKTWIMYKSHKVVVRNKTMLKMPDGRFLVDRLTYESFVKIIPLL